MITDAFRKLCFRETNKLSRDEINNLRNYINTILVPYLIKIKKENPDIDEKGIIELLTKKASEINTQCEILMVKICSFLFAYSAINHLILHPEVYQKINDSISPGEKMSIDTAMQKAKYGQYDFNYILKIIVMNAREQSSMQQQEIAKTICFLPAKYKSILDDENLSKEARLRHADDFVKKFLPGSDLKRVNETHRIYLYGEHEFLKIQKDNFSELLHNELINCILLISKELQALNLFNQYNSINYNNLSKLGLGDYAKSTFETDLTNPETLKNLSTTDLIILNLFWINRYAKEAENFASGIFTVVTNNQLSDIISGCFDSKSLNVDIIKGTLLKFHILKQHMEDKPNLTQKDLYKTFCSKYMQTSYSDYFKDLHSLHNSDNNLSRNLQLFFPFATITKSLYQDKKNLQNLMIFNLENMQISQNVGIIPNQISEDGYYITINNLPCLGFDSNLTFPVRTHIKLSTLQEYLNSLSLENTFIRIYEGYGDFTYPDLENEPISAQLVLPFSKESAKYIKRSIKELSSGNGKPQNIDLLLHLNWLKDQPAVPRKYKSEHITATRSKKV